MPHPPGTRWSQGLPEALQSSFDNTGITTQQAVQPPHSLLGFSFLIIASPYPYRV
jgi:hypothetical protein